MAKVIINEEEKNFDTSSCDTLKKLYENLLEEFATQETHVTKIKLNGEELSEVEIEKRGDLPISDIESLELIILTVPEIALNNINNAMEYLDKLITAVNKVSNLFRTKSAEEANKSYLQCIEGLTWFHEVVGNINNIYKKDLDI